MARKKKLIQLDPVPESDSVPQDSSKESSTHKDADSFSAEEGFGIGIGSKRRAKAAGSRSKKQQLAETNQSSGSPSERFAKAPEPMPTLRLSPDKHTRFLNNKIDLNTTHVMLLNDRTDMSGWELKSNSPPSRLRRVGPRGAEDSARPRSHERTRGGADQRLPHLDADLEDTCMEQCASHKRTDSVASVPRVTRGGEFDTQGIPKEATLASE
ncbi:hypothetical protein FB567DRAFT_554353 [Paraphoma chrysanthemicola]|uniref:Uncharacterized protein n=1 Tax=Paraphoma chrysanthemicola TaxID=798071 RepID=A0A8K0QUZ1_9PLEO|nr:hypothetical protein FB567DRAFT_554353 [Paraphoma chrysanthemicola]